MTINDRAPENWVLLAGSWGRPSGGIVLDEARLTLPSDAPVC
jgi:hypothetical protein